MRARNKSGKSVFSRSYRVKQNDSAGRPVPHRSNLPRQTAWDDLELNSTF
jgi:hypothetical protein